MKEIADGLRKIRERLTPEGAWTQGCFARDREGNSVDARSPRAVCWCIAGADFAENASIGITNIMEFLGIERKAPGPWNDAPGRTQAEILAKLDERIAFYSALPARGALTPHRRPAEREALKEYYEANEALRRVGLLGARDEQIIRVDLARQAIARGGAA